MGVVHHSTYLLYFEEGRTGMMRALGRSYADLESSGVVLPVVDLGIQFRTPARYDEELIVETRIASVTGVRVRFEYRVLHADESLAAEGFTLLASVGKDGRPRRFPEDVQILLESGLESPGASNR
jgi:acyl-CoA thioester hydrolase